LVRGRVMVRVGLWLDRRLGGPVLTSSIRNVLRGGERSAQGLRDLGTFRTFLTGPGMFPLLDAPWVPLYLIVIFLLHPALGWIATGAAVLLFSLALVNEFATRSLLRCCPKGVITLRRLVLQLRGSPRCQERVHHRGSSSARVPRIRADERERRAYPGEAGRGVRLLWVDAAARSHLPETPATKVRLLSTCAYRQPNRVAGLPIDSLRTVAIARQLRIPIPCDE
jgi:hypothetical protein